MDSLIARCVEEGAQPEQSMGPDTATSPDVQNLATMALLFGAAVLGGALNAVAGGGSFIGFPALLFAGISPVAANATNTVALWPGSIASALEYRSELNRSRSELVVLSASSLVGGAAGALLLLHTRESTFVALIPWLLLVATVLFTAGPTLSARFPRAEGRRPRRGECGRPAPHRGLWRLLWGRHGDSDPRDPRPGRVGQHP